MKNEKLKRYGKMKFGMVILILLAMLFVGGCDAGSGKMIKAGGLSLSVGENGQLMQGESAVWEIPGKWKIEIFGVYLDDTGEELERLEEPGLLGKTLMVPKDRFFIEYQITNLGYEIKEEYVKDEELLLSSMFNTFRINTGDEIKVRPYPFTEDDHKYDSVKLDYHFPALEIGASTDGWYEEFVTDKSIDMEKDVLVFTMFFNDRQEKEDVTYDGVFEMKFTSFSAYLENQK